MILTAGWSVLPFVFVVELMLGSFEKRVKQMGQIWSGMTWLEGVARCCRPLARKFALDEYMGPWKWVGGACGLGSCGRGVV